MATAHNTTYPTTSAPTISPPSSAHQIWDRTWAFLIVAPALIQGVYYVIAGLWPLVSIASLERVTGPKFDDWLSRNVGGLVLIIGATLCLSAYRRHKSPEILLLALSSAVFLMLIDLIYVFNRTISAVYLFDAVVQGGFITVWLYGWYHDTWTLSRECSPENTPTAVQAPFAHIPSATPAVLHTAVPHVPSENAAAHPSETPAHVVAERREETVPASVSAAAETHP